MSDKTLVIDVVDNGGQWTHREWRMLRYLKVDTQIIPNTTPVEELRELDGLILSGGAARIGLTGELGNCAAFLNSTFLSSASVRAINSWPVITAATQENRPSRNLVPWRSNSKMEEGRFLPAPTQLRPYGSLTTMKSTKSQKVSSSLQAARHAQCKGWKTSKEIDLAFSSILKSTIQNSGRKCLKISLMPAKMQDNESLNSPMGKGENRPHSLNME